MAVCPNCNTEIADELTACPGCGASIDARPVPQEHTPEKDVDSGSIGWGLLGFLIPLVGLILFITWRTSKPKCAKVAGIGAIVGFALAICYYLSLGGMPPLS